MMAERIINKSSPANDPGLRHRSPITGIRTVGAVITERPVFALGQRNLAHAAADVSGVVTLPSHDPEDSRLCGNFIIHQKIRLNDLNLVTGLTDQPLDVVLGTLSRFRRPTRRNSGPLLSS